MRFRSPVALQWLVQALIARPIMRSVPCPPSDDVTGASIIH